MKRNPKSCRAARENAHRPAMAYRRADPPVNDLRLLLAVVVVAAAAAFAGFAGLRLEAVGVGHLALGRLGVGAELGELGFEVGLGLPDGRERGGVAAGLGIVRPQALGLVVGPAEGCKYLLRGIEIERLLAFNHLA